MSTIFSPTNSSKPVPFSEHPYVQGLPSPYYSVSHREFQKACRAWMWENFAKYALDWEREGDVPAHIFRTFGKNNMLIPCLPSPLPIKLLKRLDIHRILTVKVEDWDLFHTAIFLDELSRSGLRGPTSAINVGMAFGVPLVMAYASPELRERVVPDFLTGKKRNCLAITEPEAGSDVAGLVTTARKSADGKHYILKGAKKWISNALWADYATVCARTGGPGGKGLSMLLVPLKDQPGIKMTRLYISGETCQGSTYIEFDKVKVPVSNLIGTEGEGMRYVMHNFNHERLVACIGTLRQARVALASTFEYCLRREAFGMPLMNNAVVRHRLAKAGAELESLAAWLDQFIYQVSQMEKDEASRQLGGLTALAKAKTGMVFNECAQVAVLLHGGNGMTRSGPGERIERISREVPGMRIPGGSEDVMLDLAVRQLVKLFQSSSETLEKAKL